MNPAHPARQPGRQARPDTENRQRPQPQATKPRSRNVEASVAALIAISVLFACIILEAVSLYHALDSLSQERDEANLKSAMNATLFGIALLVIGGVSAEAAHELRRIARSVNGI